MHDTQRKMTVPARLENLETLQDFITACARDQSLPEERILKLQLASEEALMNIFSYAYPDDNPGDDGLAAKAAEAQKALDAAQAESDKANENLKNAVAALTQAEEALAAAEAQAAEKAREVVHPVRASSFQCTRNFPCKAARRQPTRA